MRSSFYCSLIFLVFCLSQVYAQDVVAARFVHAIPNAPNVDVYFNEHLVFRNLNFGDVTHYEDFEAGTFDIKVVKETNGVLLYEIPAVELDDELLTFVAHGTPYQDEFPYAITKLVDDNTFGNGNTRVRFYHCAAGIGAVELIVDDDVVVSNAHYLDLSDYERVNEGLLEAAIVDSDGEIITGPATIPFDPETIVNIYFAGDDRFSSDRPTFVVAIDSEFVRESNSGSNLAISLLLAIAMIVALF